MQADGMTDLNDPRVKPLSREMAASLGFDPEFVDFVFASVQPGCLQYSVQKKDLGWTCHVPDDVEVAYPLWSTHSGDQILVCVGGGRRWFMRGFHGEPDALAISKTVQGLLADLFVEMYDSQATVEELRSAAQFCGFRHVDEVVAMAKGAGTDWNWEDAKKELVEEIDAKYE